MQFFRGVEGFPMVGIFANIVVPPFEVAAVEPDSPSNAPVVGALAVSLSVPIATELTVVYRISGSAISGTNYTNLITEYTNLTGTVTVRRTRLWCSFTIANLAPASRAGSLRIS